MTYRAEEAASKLLIIGLNGEVAAIDCVTGERAWHNRLKGGGMGEVALVVTPSHVFASNTGGATLHCLEFGSGEELWRARATASECTTLLMSGDLLLLAKGGYIDCFSQSGEKLWSNKLSGMGMGNCTLGVPGEVVHGADRA